MAKPWEEDKLIEDVPATDKPWETDKIFEGDTKQAAPVDNDPYRVKEAWTALKTAGKGIPVLGNYIDTDEAMRKFAEDSPWTAKGLQMAGGVASFLPAVKGVQLATKALPLVQKLLPQMGIYGTIGGATGAADTATNPDAQEGDLAANTKTSALWGMFGPLAGKLLSPKALPAPTPKMRPTSPYMDPAHRMGPLGKETDAILDRIVKSAGDKAKAKVTDAPMPPWAQYDKTKMLTSGMLTGGSLFGGIGIPAAAAIGSLPYTIPAAVKLARKGSQASWANKPIKGTNLTTKDIVNAMALSQAGNTSEE